jgi:hypothetical protein
MSGYVGGMSGFVRVSPGLSIPLVRFSAKKNGLAGMPEVYLGMSVACPGMPGCICTPGTFVCAKNSFGEYARDMSGYVRVCPGKPGFILNPKAA